MEKWAARKQVPETDAVYREARERERSDMRGRSVFSSEILMYDLQTPRVQAMLSRIRHIDDELLGPINEEERSFALLERKAVAQALEKEKEERASFLRKEFVRILSEAHLQSINGGPRTLFVERELAYMLDAPEAREALVTKFGAERPAKSPLELLAALYDGAIPDETLYAIAKRHVEKVEAQKRKLEAIVSDAKRDFKASVESAVEEGWLPRAAEDALGRIDEVKVGLDDRLRDVASGILGSNHPSGFVSVTNEQLELGEPGAIRHILFHEFVHEISGKSATIFTRDLPGYGPYSQIHHRKSGLVLKTRRGVSRPYRWLNEAVTERIALRLSGYAAEGDFYKGSNAYQKERRELDRLFETGLEEPLVHDAYFENVTEEQPAKQRARHFAALVRRIDALEGKHGFVKLENSQLLAEIGVRLSHEYIFPIEDLPKVRAEAPLGTRYRRIDVTVGEQTDSSSSASFMYWAFPLRAAGIDVTVESQFSKLDAALQSFRTSYGRKVRISNRELAVG